MLESVTSSAWSTVGSHEALHQVASATLKTRLLLIGATIPGGRVARRVRLQADVTAGEATLVLSEFASGVVGHAVGGWIDSTVGGGLDKFEIVRVAEAFLMPSQHMFWKMTTRRCLPSP